MAETRTQADHPARRASTHWLRRTGLVLCAVCLSLAMPATVTVAEAVAVAEPPPSVPAPPAGPDATAPHTSGANTPAPAPNAPAPNAPGLPVPPAGSPPQATPGNGLIEPELLESVQQSIVGLVIVWSEHEDPFAWLTEPPRDPAAPPELPVMSICTGWFDTPTTIATAGHCVDPEEGRVAMHMQGDGIDAETGLPAPVDYSRPAPTATVYAFQPRELPGAVLTSPVIVRVHSFRTAEDGDTAKLEVHGMPPGRPLPIAATPPRLGEPVTSIGFPGLNIDDTDGINLDKLLEGGGQTPADILQDSRLHPVNTSGTIMSRQFRHGVAVYQVNADFADGLSGGPTINTRGEVYGINSMMTLTLFAGGNFNVITDTGMLREFLEHDQPQPQGQPGAPPVGAAPPATVNAPVEAATSPSAPTPSTNTASVSGASVGWIVVGSVIGGAILGGLLVPRLRRSRLTPPVGEPAGASPGPAPA